MQKWFLKGKAGFMMFIILFSTFSVYFLKPVSADNVCCEKTLTGESCIYTDSSNCDRSVRIDNAPVNCAATSYCQTGCCYTEGNCFKNTGHAQCSAVGGTWNPDQNCNIEQCEKACCVLGSECSYTTDERCTQLSVTYNLQKDFRDAESEYACTSICQEQEKGCCVDNGNCNYVTQQECNGGFHNSFCSSVAECGCEGHATKGCLNDNVYWFDSCGNPEDIAEECDYATGLICGETDNEAECVSINCASTYDSEHVSWDGGPRKHGESWCSYEGPVAAGRDYVGSRHYRNMCINGEEIVEECRDYREEFCVDADVNLAGDVFREAACRENRWQDCATTCRTADYTEISSASDKDSAEEALRQYRQDIKNDIECCNSGDRDCYWLGDDENGFCMPDVPPGLEFWESGSSVCQQGNLECTYVEKKGLIGGWKCVKNCQCKEENWLYTASKFCRSHGDCGAYFNYGGVYTDGGFSSNSPATLAMEPLEIDSGLGLYLGALEAPEGWQNVPAAAKLMLVAGLGITAIAAMSSEVTMFTGFRLIGKFLLGKIFGAGATGAASTSAGAALSGSMGSFGTAATEIAASGASLGAATIASVVGAALTILALVIIIFTIFTKHRKVTITATCMQWDALPGGADCDKCTDTDLLNNLGYDTCTEYKCRSLGQLCRFDSESYGEIGACINSNPNDVNSPAIEQWPEALSPGFTVSELAYGYRISAIPANTRISFGIKTDEFARCKIAGEHTTGFEAMTNYIGGSSMKKEHNITLTPEPGSESNFYIRCQDAAGNSNIREYVVALATEFGPDLTPPVIEQTSIVDNAYVPYGIGSTNLWVYVNEPAECRWDMQDIEFNIMQNLFSCYGNQQNGLYGCTANLPLGDEAVSTYYFRCVDDADNKNSESFIFHLIKSAALNISSVSPSGVLYDSGQVLSVTTVGGAENGKARCAFSEHDIPYDAMTMFFETDKTEHRQQLSLGLGDYRYYIRCRDIAGNEANGIAEFTVAVDTEPPVLEYVYTDSGIIYVVLDEESNCEYSAETFSFGGGNAMSGVNATEHGVAVSEAPYYIICEDLYGNRMGMFEVRS